MTTQQFESKEYLAPGRNYSPALGIIGTNVAIEHNMFISVKNVMLNDAQGQPIELYDLIWAHTVRYRKLPENIRELITQYTDVRISAVAPLQLQFMLENQTGNAIEVFWGTDRYIVYEDPHVPKYFKFVQIPMGYDDPEKYVQSVLPEEHW